MTRITPQPVREKIFYSLSQVLRYARERDYAGYSKFDALNAPFLTTLFGWHPATRLIVTQAISRIPLNLRGLFGVRKSRNPKGIANFIKALCHLHSMNPKDEIKGEIKSLTDWLLANHGNREGRFSGICWGYNFPWQNPGFFAPRFFPNAIVTTFCAEAFLSAHRSLSEDAYLHTAVDAARYLLRDLPILEEDKDTKCIGYVSAPLRLKVVNINAVIGGFLAKLADRTGDATYLQEARKMINWTLSVKTDYHAWYYTEPPTAYVRDHDNYHTGGILDGIYDYLTVAEERRYLLSYMKGIQFYEERLFEPSGAPKWRSSKSHPFDIHGSAQGILSFTKAARYNPSFLDAAVRIALWAIENMQGPTGGFYYQKRRFFLWKVDLMRWNNSWMAWALAELLHSIQNIDVSVG